MNKGELEPGEEEGGVGVTGEKVECDVSEGAVRESERIECEVENVEKEGEKVEENELTKEGSDEEMSRDEGRGGSARSIMTRSMKLLNASCFSFRFLKGFDFNKKHGANEPWEFS